MHQVYKRGDPLLPKSFKRSGLQQHIQLRTIMPGDFSERERREDNEESRSIAKRRFRNCAVSMMALPSKVQWMVCCTFCNEN